MKKLILLVFCVPLLAMASNWVFITLSNIEDKFFIDTQSIQRNGNEVTFWERTNYSQRNEVGDLSAKVKITVNCKIRERKSIYFMFYSDSDNNGSLTSSNPAIDK